MKRYTDKELEALLEGIESDVVERKQSFKGNVPKKAREAVCAFSNDLPNHQKSGVLFIGANEREERILIEKRRFKNLPFDIHPLPSATLNDLARVFFEYEYLPAAFAQDVLAANNRTYEERLASCKMIVAPDNPIPTVLGLLSLGKMPQDFLPGAYIQF